MRDILEELYTGRYTPGFHPSEESRQMRGEYAAMLEKVQKAFSWNFVNELETLDGLLLAEEKLRAYRSGFHLGASLMLELLYAPPQQAHP